MVDRRYYEQSYDAMRVRKEELENRNLELSECERSWAKGDSLPATLSPRAIWPTGSSVRVIGGLLLALCLCSPARADIRECMEATCRIEVRQDDVRIGFGTG